MLQPDKANSGSDAAAKEEHLHHRNMANFFYEDVRDRKRERRQKHRAHSVRDYGPVVAQTGYEDNFFALPPQPQSASHAGLDVKERERRYIERTAKTAANNTINRAMVNCRSILSDDH
jgi:hypothetical protein